MGSEGHDTTHSALHVAILLNLHDRKQLSISNIGYEFPEFPHRDYIVSFGHVTINIPLTNEYHPPRDDIEPEKKEQYKIRSKKRTRRNFLNYSLANDFRYMLTLTLDPSHPKFYELQDPQIARKKFQDIFRNHKHTYRYLGVCEFQKNGSPHLHILATKELKKYLTKNEYNKNTFAAWRYGFSNISKINAKDYEKQTSYIVKYLFKDDSSKTYNYFRSKNLNKPIRKINTDISNFVVDKKFETDYGITVYNYKRKA